MFKKLIFTFLICFSLILNCLEHNFEESFSSNYNPNNSNNLIKENEENILQIKEVILHTFKNLFGITNKIHFNEHKFKRIIFQYILLKTLELIKDHQFEYAQQILQNINLEQINSQYIKSQLQKILDNLRTINDICARDLSNMIESSSKINDFKFLTDMSKIIFLYIKPYKEYILGEHSKGVLGLAISPDGKKIVSVSEDAIKIWDIESGALLNSLESDELYCVVTFIDNDSVLIFSVDNGNARIATWDLESGRNEFKYLEKIKSNHDYSFYHIQLSIKGQKLAALIFDETAYKMQVAVWDLTNQKIIKTYDKHPNSISMSLDGKQLAWTGCSSIVIHQLNLPSIIDFIFKCIKLKYDNSLAIKFSPDGKKLVSSSCDGFVHIWDLDSKTELNKFKILPKDCFENIISYDGFRIIMPFYKDIKIWDMQTGELIKTLSGHENQITSIVNLSDILIVSGSSDKTIRVWGGLYG